MSELSLLILATLIVLVSSVVVSCVVVVGALFVGVMRHAVYNRGRVAAEVIAFVFPFTLLTSCVGLVFPGLLLERYFGGKSPMLAPLIGVMVGGITGALIGGMTRLVIGRTRRFGVVGTVTLALAGAGLFMWAFSPISYRVVLFVFSGEIFSTRRIVTGGALDQPSLQKGFFIFCFFTAFICLYLLIIRSLVDRKQRRVRIVYCVLAVLCLMPALCVLTATFYDLWRYILAMGTTPKRAQGVVFGILGYLALLVFIVWSSSEWPPWWLRPPQKGLCPQCQYDLRGTPDHCPECGWRPPGEQRAVSSNEHDT